ncbi:MAG: ribonuclease [Nocardioidaceae bacterium]|nr:ribonuclease [Nocardioidaceae bacterium]
MLDDDNTTSTPDNTEPATPPGRRPRRRAASRPAGPPAASAATRPPTAQSPREGSAPTGPADPTPTMAAEPTPAAAADAAEGPSLRSGQAAAEPSAEPGDASEAPARPVRAKRSRRKAAAAEPPVATVTDPLHLTAATDAGGTDSSGSGDTPVGDVRTDGSGDAAVEDVRDDRPPSRRGRRSASAPVAAPEPTPVASTDTAAPDPDEALEGAVELRDGAPGRPTGPAAVNPVPLLFQPPDPAALPSGTAARSGATTTEDEPDGAEAHSEPTASETSADAAGKDDAEGGGRRRRSRGGRKRGGGKASGDNDTASADSGDTPSVEASPADSSSPDSDADSGRNGEEGASSHRRRRRRRGGEDSADGADDATPTTVRVRTPRAKKETITSVEGSTRIEAKKQRRREGREAGRRRPPILSESEFLARRESVERVMAIRQRADMTQIAVLEDGVLVEHYVALDSQSSLIGNVYIGRVQNVLPSMEAAFIDIGKGRNAVLYAGEVNWDVLGGTNQPRRIENALKPGQTVLVQVSKDPVGHKGARLTSQISLPGRYLVYVPAGGTSGISRKLADTERTRLKTLISDIVPDGAGVIIRTAAEGASEEELTRDVTRLTARWEDIEKKVKAGQAPALVYGEPDTTIRVVRDLFTEDFTKLVISGDDAWDMVNAYVQHVAPDLMDRIERFEGDGDIFSELRIDEQIAKALERKVWLPSGGSLVIDRTEAMTVVDVNTGKFTGSGGNLEQTVTKNNLEAAEEIVRQLRLRDIGGIIVIDFIDMVLEDNRDLVLRRLVECLGRDRTRHQVAEVTSLGLVQMTRKRISTGLIEAFSHPCDVCQGRGVVIEQEPVVGHKSEESHRSSSGSASSGSPRGSKRSSNRRRGGKSSGGDDDAAQPVAAASTEVAQAAAEPADTHEPPAAADPAGPADSSAATPDRNGAHGSPGADAAAVLTDVTVGP